MMTNPKFQTLLHLLYPPRCTLCGDEVESDFGLCGPCWRDTPFVSGLCCDLCGAPLPGEEDDSAPHCDDCLGTARPWSKGRAALIYKDNGRRLVLSLKHGDRHDIVHPAAVWMAQAAAPLITPDCLIAPVPLHWMRLFRRKFNQSALLAHAVARSLGRPACLDLLQRPRRTPSLDGLSREDRFATLDRKIEVTARHALQVQDRCVILVDDVMTTGATLSSATQACFSAGARDVRVLLLARVVQDA